METLSVKKSKRMEVDFANPRPQFPREVIFDLNNDCNCRCFFCSNHKLERHLRMDKKLGFKLLKDFYDMGTREAALYGTGEPFLRNDLAEFVAEAKRIGYSYVYISSNGTIADPKRAKPVLDAGLDSIKFSINAGTKESFIKVQGVDMFEKVIENIRWICSYRKESGLKYRVYVSMVPTAKTEGEWPILQRLLSEYVDEMDYRGCSNQGANMLENNITEKIDPKNLLGSLKSWQHRGKCPDPFYRCAVTTEGYMSVCCVDYQNYLIIADLNTTSVKDAWCGDLFVDFRKRHNSGDLKGTICYNCLHNCDVKASPLSPAYARPFKKTEG